MKKKKASGARKLVIVLYVLVLVVFFVILYIVPRVSDSFVDTYRAEYGTIEISDEVTCLLVRNERVYTAEQGGSVDRVVKEGRLMRSGAHILDVGGLRYHSDMRGVISYSYDGLESTLTPETMETLTRQSLQDLQEDEAHKVRKASSKSAETGDVIFKAVDNQQWYLLCWLNADQVKKYEEGRHVTVDFRDGTDDKPATRLDVRVRNLLPQDEDTLAILECNRYYSKFATERIGTFDIITSEAQGIMLETESLVTENGQTGVYVVDKLGEASFTPVLILQQLGDVTVVQTNFYYDSEGKTVTTVQNYDQILRPDERVNAANTGSDEDPTPQKTDEPKDDAAPQDGSAQKGDGEAGGEPDEASGSTTA